MIHIGIEPITMRIIIFLFKLMNNNILHKLKYNFNIINKFCLN